MKSRFERMFAALLLAISVAHSVPSWAQATPVLLGASSRKVHAAAGTFDLALGNVSSNPTTEPRLGPTHTIVFTFDGVVTAGTASVTEGVATAGTPNFSGSELIVPLTGVGNAQYVTVTVGNVSTAGGGTGGGGSTRIGFLAGDVNQNRVVSLADLALVNAQLAQAVTASNFLKDVNASGTLSVADKALTNTHLTQSLPSPGDASPSVVSTVPAANATNVSHNASVTIQFSEPVTVSGTWFQMACTSGARTPANTAVSGDLSATTGTTFTLVPNVSFAFGDVCTVTIFAAGISDIDTQDPPDHMAADFTFTFTVSATDAPPVVQNDATSTAPGVAVQLNVLANDSDPDHDPLSVVSFGQGTTGAVACLANGSCTYTPNAGFTGIDNFAYTAGDGHGGSTSATVTVTVLPADTTLIAPPLDLSTATTVDQTALFLYTGTNPVQTGVAPGTIQAARASILRGKVKTRDGNVLPGATVTILGNAQFGQTISRSNGAYDLAVNGARLITVNVAAAGFLPAQRQVFVPWQGYVTVPDVALVPLDAQVTAIAANTGAMQSHQSSMASDADGSRKSTLLFPAGTTATMVMSDGTTQPLATLHVRATEFTVGPNGPMAMPAQLPSTSAYTFAAEFSADEAIAAGASMVTFNQPLPTYVENFLNFPVGTTVPSGYYDRIKGQWIPSQNGKVIKIVSITGGAADLDVTGDGVADTGSALTALGITPAEQQKLATLYVPGQSLWRVPVAHFTTWDSNWPYTLPPDAQSPAENGAAATPDAPEQDTCEVGGSIVECQNQVLGEQISIVGTRYTLNYRSDRVPGHLSVLNLKLSGATVPASLEAIRVAANVGGQTQSASFAAGPNQSDAIIANHKDVYGRPMQGGQPITATIDYIYPAVYEQPGDFTINRFAGFGTGVTLGGNRSAGTISVSQIFMGMAGEGVTDARAFGLGGWMLSDHHFYDANAHVMHTGDGGRSRARAVGSPIYTIGGTGVPGLSGNGIPATQATVDPVGGLALGPDGTLYLCNFSTSIGNSPLVRRITTAGFIATIAGNATADGFNGDNILAVNAHLSCGDLAVGPDFSVYVVDLVNRRVRRISQSGFITTVAGDGTNTLGAEGVAATQTSIVPNRIALGPEGNLYIGENTISVTGGASLSRIRRVSPDGVITTLLTCASSSCGLTGLATGPDGSLYYVDKANTVNGGARIKRLRPTGVTVIVAGSGSCTLGVDGIVNALPAVQANLCNLYGLTVGPDETLYFADTNSPAIASVKVDGTIGILAGVASGSLADGILARDATLDTVDVKLSPDGAFYLSTRGTAGNARIRKISAALPGFANTAFVVASADGREVYSFDAQGRHLNTRHPLTGAILRTFTYDSAGRLSQITEKTGGTDNVTTIQHDSGGNPTGVVGPYGQVTTLAVDANGFLASIKNPANETTHFASTAGGLLTSLTDPRGKASAYAFDAQGRLMTDTDPVGGSQALARTTAPNQYQVNRTTGLSRTTSYKVEDLPGDVHRSTATAPDGTQNVSSQTRAAGVTVSTDSDGSVTTTQLNADPRFGMQSPVQGSLDITIPGGPTFTSSATLTAVLANPLDPFSMTSLSETIVLAGRSSSTTFAAATNISNRTSPAGRTSSMTVDALGRATSSQISGLDPTSITYDSRGRVATVTRGVGVTARTTTLSYNAAGFLQSLTDPLGRIFQMTYDAAGRIASKTFADGRVASVTYDAGGNVASVSPPGRPSHTFGYSDRNELTSVTPPIVAGAGPTAYSYNLDKQAAIATLPGGDTITLNYDAGGRVATRTLGGATSGTRTSSYDGAGLLASIATTGGVTVNHSHVGPLLTGRTWSGVINGAVSRTFDTSLRIASESVNGSNAVSFAYDNDDLLVGAGALTISRDAQNGLITGSQLGATQTTVGNNGFGEVVSYGASANGSPVFVDALVRDKLGRIAQKTETVDGVASTYVYSYDLAGQLIGVTKNAAVIESYAYDSNGNRTSATTNGGSAVAATYDNQDRLIQYGTASVTYDAVGNLKTRTSGGQTTNYHYDQMGNLLSVSLPGGTVISYVVDGDNRRVGKRVNGVLTQGFLYSDGLRIAAELDGSGSAVSRFVYGGTHVPVYMVKGGLTFRIISDQLGSVRVVINSTSGAVVQRMDYDSYGNVILDTNPGFQPFGFASGLYDPATGLLRFSLRDYDPPTGRWTAKDPTSFAGGDGNLYRYVRNNPVNLVDPLGTTDTSGLEHLSPENRDDIFFIIALVGSDSGFSDTLDFPLSGFPGAGTVRNTLFSICGLLWNTSVFGTNLCADDHPYRRERFCTGIADGAEAVVRRAMASGSFPGLRLQGITRDYPVTHDAMQVLFPNGESVVIDWHHSLTPFDPQIQQVTTFFGL